MKAKEKHNLQDLVVCYHCGAECREEIKHDEHSFCCEGCRLVYDLLRDNNLCTYYSLTEQPGHPADDTQRQQFEILDRPEISEKFLRFKSDERSRLVFRVDGMHCASCIWLLEHLSKIDKGIIQSEVNFPAREITVDFHPAKTSPSRIAVLLSAMGYTPSVHLSDLTEVKKPKIDPRIVKIGIAGFCFGNIMMLSFPEYLGADIAAEQSLVQYFAWLSLALSLPALYCASGFFVSAWKTIRYGTLNIDAPIALALAVTFGRSVYAIIHGGEAHYLDSMSGIIFFMLLGRYFQDRTYERMNFDRDYRSYFPIAVSVRKGDTEQSVPVSELATGDRMIIRANELIPADAKLITERSYIDYSFVSGESVPVENKAGDKVYAGARQTGGAAEFEVVQPVSSSYLTQLWNSDVISKRNSKRRSTYLDRINKWFSLAILVTAFSGAAVWLFIDPAVSLNVLTAVLIVACPCTLLLASTFTNGSVLRWLGRSAFYLKNADAIERLATADTIVFDKTGTITSGDSARVSYDGEALTPEELDAFVTVARQSGHPLSRAIAATYTANGRQKVQYVSEINGGGIFGTVRDRVYLLASAALANAAAAGTSASEVWAVINGDVKGKFTVHNSYRPGLRTMISKLRANYNVSLLSGDNDAEREALRDVFGEEMYFGKSPSDKLAYIAALKSEGKKVIMIGDGLNDSGALMAADAGIAVSDNTNNYFPACDAIIDGSVFPKLCELLSFTKSASLIVKMTFVISLLYNVIGMYFSLSGQLSPLVAAVLMPASSFTVILFTTSAVRLAARRSLKETEN